MTPSEVLLSNKTTSGVRGAGFENLQEVMEFCSTLLGQLPGKEATVRQISDAQAIDSGYIGTVFLPEIMDAVVRLNADQEEVKRGFQDTLLSIKYFTTVYNSFRRSSFEQCPELMEFTVRPTTCLPDLRAGIEKIIQGLKIMISKSETFKDKTTELGLMLIAKH